MPDGMPFMKQKGQAVLDVERAIPNAKRDLFDALVDLHGPAPVADVLDAHLSPAVPGLTDHLRRDWFGYTLLDGVWTEQPKYCPTEDDGVLVASTGEWNHYYGDVESIVRVAAIRMIELILGVKTLDYPRDPNAPALHCFADFLQAYAISTDHLVGDHGATIEIWWICPHTRFEAAVERTGTLVRLDLLTPGTNNGTLGSGYRGTDIDAFTNEIDAEGIDDVFSLVGADGSPSKGDGAQPSRVTHTSPREAWLVGQDEISVKLVNEGYKLEEEPHQQHSPISVFVGSGPVATIDVRLRFGGRP